MGSWPQGVRTAQGVRTQGVRTDLDPGPLHGHLDPGPMVPWALGAVRGSLRSSGGALRGGTRGGQGPLIPGTEKGAVNGCTQYRWGQESPYASGLCSLCGSSGIHAAGGPISMGPVEQPSCLGIAHSEGAKASSSDSALLLQGQPSATGPDEVSISVFRPKRTGQIFTDALLGNPSLAECRTRLELYFKNECHDPRFDIGYWRELSKQTWLFLDPAHVIPVLLDIQRAGGITLANKQLQLADLRTWHIIAGPTYCDIVADILLKQPSSLQLHIRDRTELRIRILPTTTSGARGLLVSQSNAADLVSQSNAVDLNWQLVGDLVGCSVWP